MTRDTIDFGIDLGTTNSVIAVSEGGEIEVIKNGLHSITPSMIFIDKRGREVIGHAAAQNLTRPTTAADVQSEFKREMGTSEVRSFSAAGREMSPTELSAMVLKELRNTAAERFGSAPIAAAITVPAWFDMTQRDATSQAAKLAGFEHSVLLQEPVAAAAAYGFQTESDKAYWMVYDYGIGTFDASIVSIRDGQLTVVKHGGDNYLGGADFDRTIVDEFLVPAVRKEYDLDDLDRSNIASCAKTKARFAMLQAYAEKMKMNLSRDEEDKVFEESLFDDNSGDPVDLECTIKRSEFELAIEKFVHKSIDITSELIDDCGLKSGDIEKILLVGGSTFVPLVQHWVESFGIPVDRSMDPMTVVAYGAAVFASSQRIPKEMRSVAPVVAGSARVELEYEPVGKDLKPPVAGKVSVDGGPPPAGTSVELKRSDDGWASGRLLLDGKGFFMTDVMLREKGQSSFAIEVCDKSGTVMECTPSKFAITYGMSVGKATLPSGIQVGLADGTVMMILPAGTTLPATSAIIEWRIDRRIRKGSSDELRIPILCGDEPEAELNLAGTTVILKGTDISGDLPAGSEILIVFEVCESGTSSISFTIPLLDETFEFKQSSVLEHESAETMWERLRSIRSRLQELEEKGEIAGQSEAVREVRAYAASDDLSEIDRLIEKWEGGDAVAAGQARNSLVAAAKKLKELGQLVEWPAKLAAFDELKDDARRSVHEYGDGDDRKMMDSVLAEVDRSITDQDPRMLDRAESQLRVLHAQMLQKNPVVLDLQVRQLDHLVRDVRVLVDRFGADSDVERFKKLLSRVPTVIQSGKSDDLVAAFEALMQDIVNGG